MSLALAAASTPLAPQPRLISYILEKCVSVHLHHGKKSGRSRNGSMVKTAGRFSRNESTPSLLSAEVDINWMARDSLRWASSGDVSYKAMHQEQNVSHKALEDFQN
jgi:hypothetical protein